ncbi:MAG: stage V sporulation protein AE [Clostridia bacterium]|nr:stage V sporulation protein AE [Clostridia bacterium]
MELLWDILKAFLVGGAICAVAQILIDKTALTPARILVFLVTLGVVLGALGVYKPFIEFAGCGASTPLTGFGYTLAEGVKKAVEERGLIGALTGGLTGSAGGITAAVFFGYFFALIFRSKPRD